MVNLYRRAALVDQLRDYTIIIDGVEVGHIGQGEMQSLYVRPGEHVMHLEIDWCRSKKMKFTVEEDKDLDLVCYNPIDGFQIFFIFLHITLLMKRYVYLDVLSEKEKAEILHKDVAIDLSEHSFMRNAPTRGWRGIIENTLHALTK